jgi:peptidoglycan-N-acetylglucosamine deacetylase
VTTPRRKRGFSPSWIVAVVLVLGFVAILTVAGFGSVRAGNDAGARQPGPTDSVPDSVLEGGPWVDAIHSPVSSRNLPPKTIALTFDDGPDPTWTPQVVAVLRRHHVPGTFFVVGSNVSRYPDLVRAIRDAGSELGVHTFAHPDLGNVSPWRMQRELDETQLAIAGSAGVTTYLLRPPYSSTAEAVDDLGYDTVLAAGALGYVTVFTTQDSEDWQRPGVAAVVRNATPRADDPNGAVVLMHDAGGDRSETVTALDQYIPQMQAKGYRFTTVTAGFGMPAADTPASSENRASGEVLLDVVALAVGFVTALRWILLVVGVLVAVRIVLMVIAARRLARRRRSPDWHWGWGESVTQPVSVIVPAYNESANIEATVASIIANDYPLEVLVVDDGSSDDTAAIVESLALARVRVLRQVNGGKSAALNAGIRAAQYGLVIMIDGDTIFEPDTVWHLVQPFADPSIGAVAGNVKIANRDDLIGRLQHIEYVIGFNIDRRVQDVLGSIATIPGAAGAFRRDALLRIGGLSSDTLAEDTDLTIALGRSGWRVVFEDKARAWTEAPATISQLWRQRFRWSYGTMQAIWKHRRAVREAGMAGKLGRRGLVHVAAFHIVLPLTAPLIDVFLVYGLLFEDAGTAVLLWLAMLLVQLAGALFAFRLEGERPGALWVLPVQQLVYRQLMYVVLIQSMISAITGARVRWQRMHRVGVLGQLLPAVASAPAAARPARSDRRPVAPPAPPVLDRKADQGRRERWLDVLRAGALVRVVIYNATSVGWLSIVFPSTGVLFAVGGSLMVASMRRTPAIDVIGHRLRRILPPVWVLAAVLVPFMLWRGWAAETGDTTLTWTDLVFWVLPILDPPGSASATDATVVLWYVRAYLWFVLLTPLMLAAFRRWPVRATLAPLAIVVVNQALGWDLQEQGGFGPVLLDFGTFATCWMLGFAHREAKLKAIRPVLFLGLALSALAAGGVWTYLHPAPETGFDLGGIPLGQALISAGAVLLLLRINPALGWVDRVPGLARLLAVINARVVTIYLTHNIAIAVAGPIDTAIGANTTPAYAATVTALIILAVLGFGWLEDLGARRPVKLIPGGKRAHEADPTPSDRGENIDPSPRTVPIPIRIPTPLPAPRSAAPTLVPTQRHTVVGRHTLLEPGPRGPQGRPQRAVDGTHVPGSRQ